MIGYVIVRIADVENGGFRPESEIWVEDGRIFSFARPEEAAADVPVVDIGGKTVLPGLFNVHTHIQFDSTPKGAVIFTSQPRFTVSALKNLKKYLYSGVMFIRDMGGADYVDIEIRDMVREGLVEGPEMVVSGKNLSATGGQSWQNGVEVDGRDACIRAVRQQCKKDVDWVKFMASGWPGVCRTSPYQPHLSLEEMQTIVQEANRLERKVAAHAVGGLSAKYAAMAGAASIDHGYYLDEETLDIMAEKGICYVPTLAINHFMMQSLGRPCITQEMVDTAERQFEVQMRSLQLAMEKGVTICVGTDACSPYNDHDGTAHELIALTQCGMSPAEAIRSATVHSAKLCGQEDCRGSIAEGKVADLAIFEGDPFSDVSVLTRCAGVIQKGKMLKKVCG
ncbi:MAG: amidohydrolase family protein [Christensenellaceae bacterium]|nr:amidohydrolase family protein [Christensenellaceae bacterium]